MKCIIVSNGSISDYSFYKTILEGANYVICADGGARHLINMNIVPDVIIGDLDSISEEAREFFLKEKVKFHKFPSNKDATDTELSVDFALSHSPSEVILLGAIGSRMDHSIANASLLKKILDAGAKGRVINENNEIYILNTRLNELVINGEKGDFLSLIPMCDKVSGITLDGLKYPLKDAEISFGSSLGISNEFEGNKAKVRIKEGVLLVIKARD